MDQLRQQVGSLLMVGFQGTTPEEPELRNIHAQLASGAIAGVVLYGYNIQSPEQLITLTTYLAAARPGVLLALDAEGGKVHRLQAEKGFHGYPAAAAVARDYSIAEAELIYSKMARELLQHGVNFNLGGPVLDINDPISPCPVIGGLDRSYGPNPEQVAEYAGAFVRAHRAAGVLTAAKHFPGHGLARGDTHHDLIDTTATANPPRELRPYEALLARGYLDAVMTAHIVNKINDPLGHPATLSSRVIPELLRGRLGYSGVVVSDDLHMGAILRNYPLTEAAIMALLATCDLLLFSNNPGATQGFAGFQADPQIAATITEAILAAVSVGRLPRARIDEARRRVAALKAK